MPETAAPRRVNILFLSAKLLARRFDRPQAATASHSSDAGSVHMSHPSPSIYLVRHGETAWTKTRQHTGLTDLPLTEIGERDARRLGDRLKPLHVPFIFT